MVADDGHCLDIQWHLRRPAEDVKRITRNSYAVRNQRLDAEELGRQ